MTPRHVRLSFMDPLVLAIAAGHKSVTRRLVRRENSPEPGHLWRACSCRDIDPADTPCVVCEARFTPIPARPGDVMDVCEALVPVTVGAWMDGPDPCDGGEVISYRADGFIPWGGRSCWPWKVRVLPARYCPTGCVRHHRSILSVRPERLSDVTDAEAALEGIRYLGWPETRDGFLSGFRKLHGLAKDADPWVWRIEWASGKVPR